MRSALTVLILIAVLWFAVTNAPLVVVHLFFWTVQASLALVVGITFLLGFLLGVLHLAPGFFRNRSAAIAHAKSLDETRKERDQFAERSKTLEEQVHILAPVARDE